MITKPLKGAVLNRGHSLSKDTIGAWLLNDRTGSYAADIIGGNRQHGALSSGLSWNARGLSGFGESTIRYIDVGNNSIARPSNAFTIEMICLTRSSITGYLIFVSNNLNSPANGPWLGSYSGALRLYWGNTNEGNFGSASISASTWYHLVWVIKENDYSHVYVDGVYGGASGVVSSFGWNGSEHFAVGHDSLWNNQGVFTECELVRYWGRALTAIEIKQLYNKNTRYQNIVFVNPILLFHVDSGAITGIHTAFALEITNGSHIGVVGIIAAHTASHLQITNGTHTGYVGVVGSHTATSLQVTNGTHSGVVGVTGVHSAFSIAVTNGTHTFSVGVIGQHSAFSISVTNGNHAGVVGVVGTHTSFQLQITNGTHVGDVGGSVIGVHTAFSLSVTNGSHFGVVGIIVTHTAYSLALTLGTHSGSVGDAAEGEIVYATCPITREVSETCTINKEISETCEITKEISKTCEITREISATTVLDD